jgi:hypothetical protein
MGHASVPSDDRSTKENTVLYKDWAPTQFDRSGAFLPDHQDWEVGPCLKTRDSGPWELANFDALIEALEAVDPEADDHFQPSFNHWGPGWVEITLCRPGSKAAIVQAEIASALADYPVVDESKLSEYEYNHAIETIPLYVSESVSDAAPDDWEGQVYSDLEVEVDGNGDLHFRSDIDTYMREKGWLDE